MQSGSKMTINITNVKLNGDYIRVTATGEFNLKVPRGPDAAYDFFAETAVTLSHDDIQAIQKAIDDEGLNFSGIEPIAA